MTSRRTNNRNTNVEIAEEEWARNLLTEALAANGVRGIAR